MSTPEEKFKMFCENRKWKVYKIPELPNIPTPDFLVVPDNQTFVCEVKCLFKSGTERKDITEFKNEKGKIEGICGDYNKEIDSIVNAIEKARLQFKTTLSFGLPNVLVIYSKRFMPIDKDMLIRAAYGKRFSVAKFNKNKNKFIFKEEYTKFVDISFRKDKNNLISAIAIQNGENGMFLLHNLWSEIPLHPFVFNTKNDVNYLPKSIQFIEIKGNEL